MLLLWMRNAPKNIKSCLKFAKFLNWLCFYFSTLVRQPSENDFYLIQRKRESGCVWGWVRVMRKWVCECGCVCVCVCVCLRERERERESLSRCQASIFHEDPHQLFKTQTQQNRNKTKRLKKNLVSKKFASRLLGCFCYSVIY